MTLQMQQTIKNNAMDVREYVKGLYDWEQQMEIKQKIKTKKTKKNEEQRKIIEKQSEKMKAKQKQQQLAYKQQQKNNPDKKVQLVRDSNTIHNYYKAWDSYNPDKQLQKLQEEELAPYRPYNPYEDSKNITKAKPKTGLVIKGNRNTARVKDPTSLKDKGNLHFKVCEYSKAIQVYTQCISRIHEKQMEIKGKNTIQSQKQINQRKKLMAVVFSNRAMSYLKVNQTAKALLDCNKSLQYDDKYMKTYLRRADCLKKLGRYHLSLNDYKKITQNWPEEKEAQIEIKKLETFMKRKIKQAHESMIINPSSIKIEGGFRIPIQEIQTLQSEEEGKIKEIVQNQSSTNYLDQL